MDALPLRGRAILVAEDEPLIALELKDLLEEAGAKVISAPTVQRALEAAQRPALAAAVLDHRLADGDACLVCEQLRARNVPVLIYTGSELGDLTLPDACILAKPAGRDRILATLTALVRTSDVA
jgi:DNA-binding response OmpR family regulator